MTRMAGLRSISILFMLSIIAVNVDSNYEGSRKGENTDPAGVDTEDLSVVMKNGTETVEQEKALAKKMKQLDKRRHNDTMEEGVEREEEVKSKDNSTDNEDRTKRYISAPKTSYWIKAIIPYVIRDVKLTVANRNVIKSRMQIYEHHTCFRFVEWDNTTQTKYGLDHNNYLSFIVGGGCWSAIGNRRLKSGGQDISCCGGTTCIHEIGHALGFQHEQKSPLAKDVLRPNMENVQPRYKGQYVRSGTYPNLRYFDYDLSSVMHYGLWDFNNGKGPTMTLFDPKLKYLVGAGSSDFFYFFKELSIMYKCKEMKCPDFKLKCENTGYVAYIESKCRCRCPTGLDPATGCTTVISNELNTTLTWPESRFALLRPANTPCPENSKEGSLTLKSDGGFTNDNYQAMGDHDNLHFCTFDHVNRSGNADLWPSGEYCLTKAGGSCPKSGCPFGWTLNEQNRHCYKLFTDKVKGYTTADFCRQHNAYIVKIDDQTENEYVRTLINSRYSRAYIGGNDIKTEGVFVGDDGKNLKYLNWHRGEPNNWRNNEDCIFMAASRYGQWYDVRCGDRYPVVCEMPLAEFNEGFIEFENDSVSQKGTLPNVMSGGKTKLEFCCREDGNNAAPVVMPTANKFILWQMNRDGCQRVKDTIAVSNHFGHRLQPGKTATINGTTPLGSVANNLVYAYFCVYQPISKDCGKTIELTDENPTAVVTSPYYPHSYHANMECTWLIKSKKNTRIVLSFENFEIPTLSDRCDDSLEIRLDLPGQPGIKFCGHEFKTSVYSFTNYMSLILDSKSYVHGKKFNGIVTMIRDEDLCYYGLDQGASYRGTVNFSRNFKACLPWNETTHCVHSPNNIDDAFSGLDSNFCRNPRPGTDPWCYTQSKGCIRDYCDVCGLGTCVDYYADCADRLMKDPNYCTNTTAWDGIAGCTKTCGLCNRQTKMKYAEISCTNPSIPKDVVLVNSISSSTGAGKTVDYYYPTNKNSIFSLRCFSDGSWLKSECPIGWIHNPVTKKCNKVIAKRFTGQYAGNEICRKYRGYLASIKDQAENEFMRKMVKKATLIGYSDKLKENSWVWSNGENSTYTNWANVEPNNLNNEDCSILNPNGEWNDLDCQSVFQAVACQISLPVSSCEDGTTNCYRFMTVQNVAQGKPAKQSSIWPGFDASKAVNGKLTTYSHTMEDNMPWWQVDLEKVYPVKKILIANRIQRFGERLRNMTVTIGKTEDDMKECVFYEGPGASNEYIELTCTTPLSGQFVKLQLNYKGYMQLTEVYVYTPTPQAK